VTVRCENVPAGIQADDHQAGLKSTLSNLAAFAERGTYMTPQRGDAANR
jgi:hypothetical protein